MTRSSDQEIDPALIEKCLADARREAVVFARQLGEMAGPSDGPLVESTQSFDFRWTASAVGFGYIEVLSVSTLDFTNGHKLSFHGRGGGLAGGGGIYFGKGFLTVHPSALDGVKAAWTLGAIGGGISPNGIRLGFVRNNQVLGMYAGFGPLLFNGVAGGEGTFTRG